MRNLPKHAQVNLLFPDFILLDNVNMVMTHAHHEIDYVSQ